MLLDIPEQPPQPKQAEAKGRPKLRFVDRQQTTMATIHVEELIPSDHKARAIWELAGRMDLGRFCARPQAVPAGPLGTRVCW
jgi:hypothetical protein